MGLDSELFYLKNHIESFWEKLIIFDETKRNMGLGILFSSLLLLGKLLYSVFIIYYKFLENKEI